MHQRTCEVNRMGENNSFIFTCNVKAVLVHDFKLVWVVENKIKKQEFIHKILSADLEISLINSTLRKVSAEFSTHIKL